ncbi:MAG: hypothetical protein P8Y74_16505, partial [Desulfobacterales bacterium]
DQRAHLRNFFEVSRYHIALASIEAMVQQKLVKCTNCVLLLSKYRFKIRNILLHNRQEITFQWDISAGIKNGTLNILCFQSINGRLDRTRMIGCGLSKNLE